jgi:hypothetical protein
MSEQVAPETFFKNPQHDRTKKFLGEILQQHCRCMGAWRDAARAASALDWNFVGAVRQRPEHGLNNEVPALEPVRRFSSA